MYLDQYEANAWKLDGEETQETFKIDSDVKAEWALKKIKEHQEEHERIKQLCESMIAEYKDRLLENDKELERNTGYFKSLLRNYFDTVPHKATKTQEVYKLGLGKLVLKKQSPEIKTDNEKLLEWLKNSNKNEFVQTTEKPAWGELKKTLQQLDNKYITEDGEVVEGIELFERDDKFEVII